MQPDGYVKIRDRSKDIIISGGENISSIEVEETLYRHPAVLSAAVVAQPDEKWGETPCAFVELKPGATRHGGGAARLLPRAHGAVQGAEDASCSGELPKTSTGKIQKFVLRELASSASVDRVVPSQPSVSHPLASSAFASNGARTFVSLSKYTNTSRCALPAAPPTRSASSGSPPFAQVATRAAHCVQ